MRAAEYLQQRPLPIIVAAGVLLGLVVGLAWPVPQPPAAPASASAWGLPAPAAVGRYDEARFAKVRGAPIWGANSASAARKRPTWRLTGIITDPVAAALVAAEGDSHVAHVKVGESLPGNGKVVRITARGLTFTRDGCTYERILYSTVDPKETAPCTLPAAAQRPQQKHE